MQSEPTWILYHTGVSKKDELKKVLPKPLMWQSSHPEFLACHSSKRHRRSKNSGWMGAWSWDKGCSVQGFYAGSRCLKHKLQQWVPGDEMVPVATCKPVYSRNRQGSGRCSGGAWPSGPTAQDCKNKTSRPQTLFQNQSWIAAEKGRENWKCNHLSTNDRVI